jgi:hypothetical protein
VNHPAAVIYDALVKAGYNVALEEFDGQFQYKDKSDWPRNELEPKKLVKNFNIEFEVEACP